MYQNMPQHGGGRGGYYPRNKFQPPNMGGPGGEFSPYQGNMRRGNSRGNTVPFYSYCFSDVSLVLADLTGRDLMVRGVQLSCLKIGRK